MLRISTIEARDRSVTLRLEGRLVGPWVEELRQSCDVVLAGGRGLALDLGDVSFVDASGVLLVRTLTGRQVRVLRCSLFVAEQLRTGSLA
jgi:anti-anti-sigma regulatory factor